MRAGFAVLVSAGVLAVGLVTAAVIHRPRAPQVVVPAVSAAEAARMDKEAHGTRAVVGGLFVGVDAVQALRAAKREKQAREAEMGGGLGGRD